MAFTVRNLLATTLVGIVVTPAAADEKPVSFANDVAPMLVDQCLACHNARTAKGRFSLQTYEALMEGGESGAAVDPGDGDFSNLVLLVESGEMPQDGDPLPPEHVATLKRWIAAGAKLDDGKPADAPLRSIMPRPEHPSLPEVYPAPVPVTALAFDPQGKRLAVSGYHEVLIFDPGDGRLIERIDDVAERVHGLSFSPDGRRLAIAAGTPGRYGEVKLVHIADEEPDIVLVSAADTFCDVAYSPDGSRLAAAGADRTVRVWNVADAAEIAHLEDHADWVTAVAFSPDGRQIATASRDKTAKVIDCQSGETVATFAEHEAPVRDIAFSADGKRVATCGGDRRLRIWNASDAKQHKSSELGGEGLMLIRLDDDSLVCGSGDRATRHFDFDGKQHDSRDGLSDWPTALAATPEGDLLAIGTADGYVTIRKGVDGDDLRTFAAMPPKP